MFERRWSVVSILYIFLLGILYPPPLTMGIGDTHLCSGPLGMESGAIPNAALSASSYYVKNVGPETARLNRETQGGAWCPREPISIGVHEYLQVSLNGTHLLSAVQMQGRYSNGLGQEYTEEFQLEYWREGFTSWRKYYRFDGKSVFPGNTDTSSVVTTKLRPPLLAGKVRFVPYSAHRRVVCLRVELLGCSIGDGLVQYSMQQGDTFSEGISLKDESYDGEQGSKWDRRVGGTNDPLQFPPQEALDSNSVNENSGGGLNEQSGESESDSESISTTVSSSFEHTTVTSVNPRVKLYGGLGQLTDKIEGANSFTMDMGYGLGNGWVGWKRRQDDDGGNNDFVEILFEFDTVRVFSYVNILTNNYPSKGVQFFSRCRCQFSVGGVYFSTGQNIEYSPPTVGIDLSQEQTKNVTIPLEENIGKYLKLQLFYRSHWIVLGEVYFHTEIFEGNWTEEETGSSNTDNFDFPMDTQAHLEIGDLDGSMLETVVGILTALILFSAVVGGLVICMRKNGGRFITAFHFHSTSGESRRGNGGGSSFPFPWRHSWNSVPTHIVTQTNSGTEGVKDLLLTLTPMTNGQITTTTTHLTNGDANVHQNNALGAGGMLINGGFHKVHNNLQVSPPPYSAVGSATLTRNLGKNNQLNKFQESEQNNYAVPGVKINSGGKSISMDNTSSTSGCYSSNNGSSASSNEIANGRRTSHRSAQHANLAHSRSPNKMAQRGPVAGAGSGAALEGESSEVWGLENEHVPENEYSTGHYNSTLRSSTSRHRKGKTATSSWNLSFEGSGKPLRSQRGTCLSDISLRQLRLIENLGSCLYGQVHLYDFEGEVESSDGSLYQNGRLIAKTIKSLSEIRLLNVLDHEHVLQMICVCTELKKPILALYPAPECGDLCSFLSRLTNTPSLSWLLTVASQIASGMNYLESLQLVHRDLAARNCLVEREGTIRIADLAMACEQYRDDYCTSSCEDLTLMPLRWYSWETILDGQCTTHTSVWSFGVTLWEILTLCRQRPLHHIPDHQLSTIAEKYGEDEGSSGGIWLAKPVLSPPEIFELMRECWRKEPGERPTFQHIHLFLEQKCSNSMVSMATATGLVYSQ